jgi:hypothetical protein
MNQPRGCHQPTLSAGDTRTFEMKSRVTLRRALEDSELLGSVLSGSSWHAWRSLLLAANGEPLNDDELLAFSKYTGRAKAPEKRVDELWCAVGRRGGKSRAMATMAAYYAGLCDYSDKLAKGETGVVLLIAQDKRAAKVSLDYAEGALDSTPMLRQLIKHRQREELLLTNGITLEVRAPTLRGVRGTTCVAVICDEIAFGDRKKAQILTPRFFMQADPVFRRPMLVAEPFGMPTGVSMALKAIRWSWSPREPHAILIPTFLKAS